VGPRKAPPAASRFYRGAKATHCAGQGYEQCCGKAGREPTGELRAAEVDGAAAASERSEGAPCAAGLQNFGVCAESARRRVCCTGLNCELARFAKCSEQLLEATYLAKSTPFKKKMELISLYIHPKLGFKKR
jgi:hypothetical protein